MSLAAKCLQILLIIFNLGFLVFAILLTTIGSYAEKNTGDGSDFNRASMAILIIGIASIVGAVFGIFGACCRQRILLMVYALLLVALAICQITVGSIAISTTGNQSKIEDYSSNLWRSFNDEQKVNFQNDNQCCGFNLSDPSNGGKCPSFGSVLQPCQPKVQDSVIALIKASAIYLFIGAACEIFAVMIAFVLISDKEKRRGGYGRGY